MVKCERPANIQYTVTTADSDTASFRNPVARLTFYATVARRHVVVARTPEAGKRFWITEVLLPMAPGPQLREPISPYIIRGLRNLLLFSLKTSLHAMLR